MQVLLIEGMMCQKNCGTTVQRALSQVPGVEKAEVSFASKTAHVWGSARAPDLIEAVEVVGFGASLNQNPSIKLSVSRTSHRTQNPSAERDSSLPRGFFSIQGNQAASSIRTLKQLLLAMQGVQFVAYIPSTQNLEVSFDLSLTNESSIVQAVASGDVGCSLTHLNTSGAPASASINVQETCEEVALEVTGMSCAACVIKVERALLSTPGVVNATVNLATKRASIQLAPKQGGASAGAGAGAGAGIVNAAALADAITRLGFKAKVTELELSPEALQKSQQHEVTQWQRLLTMSLVFTLPLLFIKMLGRKVGLLHGLYTCAPGFGLATTSELLQGGLATPVQIIVGWRFYAAAFKGLVAEHRSMGMDFLVAAGTSIAYSYSLFSLVGLIMSSSVAADGPGTGPGGNSSSSSSSSSSNSSNSSSNSGMPAMPDGMHGDDIMPGDHHIFFDASAMLLTFITLGKMLEALSTGRTTDALTKLMNLQVPTHITMFLPAWRVAASFNRTFLHHTVATCLLCCVCCQPKTAVMLVGYECDEVTGEYKAGTAMDEKVVAATTIPIGAVLKVVPGATIPVDGQVVCIPTHGQLSECLTR
jgi:cation transport ATPase